MFNSQRKGLALSRSNAADFVEILVHTHEDAGFKSPDEDILLTLVQGGSKFKDEHWLSEVTPALIVKPPLLHLHNHDVALKLANAVSFHTEGQGKKTSFNARFSPIVTDALASDINLSNGKNFPTPALNGAIFAMRLGTFLNLPTLDHSQSMDPWLANLDLSLNLWLCADGIDILEDVEAILPEKGIYTGYPIDVEQVAKLASTWMDDLFRERFFQAYVQEVSSTVGVNDDVEAHGISRLDWETAISKFQRFPASQHLYKRCRSFDWYIHEVNTDLSEILDAKLMEDHRFDVAEEKGDELEKVDESEEGDSGDQSSGSSDESGDKDVEKLENEVEEHHAPPGIEDHDKKKNSGEEHSVTEKKKPKKPLRPENLEIVQKPKMVNIAYVDASGGHVDFPHKQALDADGKPGYLHDETFLRKNPPGLQLSDNGLKNACSKRDYNWRMMTERIVVETEYEKSKNDSGQKRDKIFCLVYTIEKFHDRIPNILQTWG